MAGRAEAQTQADAGQRVFGMMSAKIYLAAVVVLLMIAAALRYNGQE